MNLLTDYIVVVLKYYYKIIKIKFYKKVYLRISKIFKSTFTGLTQFL